MVKWSITLDVPHTWTRPWTIALPLTRDNQPCRATSATRATTRLGHILSAARADERAATQKTQK